MTHCHHHGQQAAHRRTDYRNPLGRNGVNQGKDVLQVDRRLIVLRVGIACRQSSAAYVWDNNPIAALQVGSEIFEVAAVARQPVQAEHGAGERIGAWVNSRIELQAVLA
jgi:hypothetical protein